MAGRSHPIDARLFDAACRALIAAAGDRGRARALFHEFAEVNDALDYTARVYLYRAERSSSAPASLREAEGQLGEGVVGKSGRDDRPE